MQNKPRLFLFCFRHKIFAIIIEYQEYLSDYISLINCIRNPTANHTMTTNLFFDYLLKNTVFVSPTQISKSRNALRKKVYCKQVPMTSKNKESRKWLDFKHTRHFTTFCDNFIPALNPSSVFKDTFYGYIYYLQYKFVYRTTFLHTDIIVVKKQEENDVSYT